MDGQDVAEILAGLTGLTFPKKVGIFLLTSIFISSASHYPPQAAGPFPFTDGIGLIERVHQIRSWDVLIISELHGDNARLACDYLVGLSSSGASIVEIFED